MTPEALFDRPDPVIRVVLAEVLGSSPREAGTEMFVAATALVGTIGGGRLEFIVIARARAMIAAGDLADHLDIPLGPEIGQCCGGRVRVALTRMSARDRQAARERCRLAQAVLPHVYVMGAGHVGRALASQLQHLPVHCVLIDMRAEELAQCSADVEMRLSALPECDIRNAPQGSAFVVLTHDHALDFLLSSEALARGDAAYVGMIGSATKRAKFASWCREMCGGQEIGALTCPIGASGSPDKRPNVIAAFVAAELIAELTSDPAATARQRGVCLPEGGRSTGQGTGGHEPEPALRPMGGGTHRDQPELHLQTVLT